MQKSAKLIFFLLVTLSLLAPLWVFKDLLFPYVTSKAFYFRILIEAALPFYVYLLMREPTLRPGWRRNYLNWFMVAFLVLAVISSFTGVSVIRSLFGNFERMGGAFYIAHLTLLYFYVLMIGQMGDTDIKKLLSYSWPALFGLVSGAVMWWLDSLSFTQGIGLTFSFVVYYLFICWFDGPYIKRLLQAFLLVALVVTLNGFFGKLGLPTFVADPSLPARVSSTLGNPIYLGTFLMVPMFLAVFFGRQAERLLDQLTYYVCAFLFLIGIVISGTRGAAVGLVVGVFLGALTYLFFTKSKKIKLYGSGVVAAGVVVYILLSIFNAKLPQGTDLQRLFKLKDSNTSARLIQWKTALRGYLDYPILGVGPENYYIIANKYYNPALYQFDSSWFDKPHNYWIEILTTQGILGFLAYIGIMLFIVGALYKGYKSGLLTLFEFCTLLGGLIAYQVQNLTVFDTVPASLAFYSFLGLAAFIGSDSGPAAGAAKTAAKKLLGSFGQEVSFTAAGVSLLVVIYMLYAGNIVPMEIAKAVNYGYAYSAVNPQTADNYFQRAMTLPFNFDKTETASKYSDFATGFAQSATPAQQGLEQQVIGEATDALNQALAVQSNYAILWENLSEVYFFKGLVGGQLTSLDPGAEDAINHAIALAPNRPEAYLTLAQIRAAQGNTSDAETILQQQIQKFPTSYNPKIQLANLYRLEGKTAQAVKLMEQAQAENYTFSSYGQMQWIISYYVSQKDYQKALALQQAAEKVEPQNVQVYEDLASLYADTGQDQAALQLAQNIMTVDTSTIPQMQALINSLHITPSSTPAK